MEPIKGNNLNRSCGEIISSNCVAWAGGAVDGVCGPNPTLTQVVQSAISSSSGCCEGNFSAGHQSCYTGSWVNFSSFIPTSGIGGGLTWGIGAYGGAFPTGSGAENVPEYRWTKDGDLKVRGSFSFTVTPAPPVTNSFIVVPLVTIPATCFPTNATLSQTAIVSTDSFVLGNSINTVTRGFLTINPLTGVLYFNFSFAQILPSAFSVQVFLGGTTFNLA